MTIDALKLLAEIRARNPGGGQPAASVDKSSGTAEQIGPVDAGALLADIYEFLGRFIAYPSEQAHVAHVLWIIHAHLMEAWESTPRIAFLSPEPGSGKTRAMEITETLVPRACETINTTVAYLFRRIAMEEQKPTLLLDEVDALFKGRGPQVEDIRALINAGHRRGAKIGRCVVRGKTIEPEEVEAYCAVALAGLGWLPDTLMSRSIIIRMRKRAPDEVISPYRRRYNEREGHELRDRIAAWASSRVSEMAQSAPEMPAGVEDRAADVWEPLLAIADAVGGDWPARVRAAAVAMVASARDANPSLGVQLLTDIKMVFRDAKQLATEMLLAGLYELPEAPWKTINKGLPFSATDLAGHLREYDIRSHTLKSFNRKGYHRAHFEDAWRRYVPSSLPSENVVTPVTNVTMAASAAAEVTLVTGVTPSQGNREGAALDPTDPGHAQVPDPGQQALTRPSRRQSR
jgi:hypothetical protein